MKAYELRGFNLDSIVLADRPDPKPGPFEVSVRVRAVSLNFRDLLVAKGLYDPKMPLPAVPCSDGAGEVAAVGAGVTRVKVGDRGCGIFMQEWLAGRITDAASGSALGAGGPGMLAEQVVLHEDGVVRFPAHLSFEEAATLPCAAVTAWHALVTAGGIKAGDTVLTQGTGGVSIFALQFARLNGASVIATSSSDAKLARVLEMGASSGINYKSNPDWEKKVLELTGGVGVDRVIEVGGSGTLPRSLKAVKLAGTISLIGILTGVGEFNPLPVLMKAVRVQGIFVGSRAMFEAMNRAIALHQLKPVVDRVFPFREAREALRYMESGSHFGKIAIRMA